MSTRAIIRVFNEENVELVTIYQHGDGYPQWCGKELTKFIRDISIVEGITFGEKTRIANGYECLAAQLVHDFKTMPGGIYLVAPGTKDMDQDFEYEILPNPKLPRPAGPRQPYLMMYAVDRRELATSRGNKIRLYRKLLHAGNALESINYLIDEHKVDFSLPKPEEAKPDAPVALVDPGIMVPQ